MELVKTHYLQALIGLLTGVSWFVIFKPPLLIGVLVTLVTICLVIISGSLTLFFLAEIVSFSVLVLGAAIYLLIPGSTISSEFSLVLFVVFALAGPLVINRTLKPNFISATSLWLETTAALLGLITAVLWRIVMPNNGLLALNSMYGSEDYSGIIGSLARANNSGINLEGTRALGEWSNVFYSAVSFVTSVGNDANNHFLIAPLVQWNFIIFCFWLIPITSSMILVFLQTKTRLAPTIFLFMFVAATNILLIWPFAPLGHLSVIFSICILLPTFGYLSSKSTRIKLGFIGIIWLVSSSYLAANIWFPSGIISLGFLALVPILGKQLKLRKSFIWLFSILGISAIAIRAFNIVSDNSAISLFAAQGLTRSASTALVTTWFFMIIFTTIFFKSKQSKHQPLTIIFVYILATNLLVWASGLLLNENDSGYGATKFLLYSICVTFPVLVFRIIKSSKPIHSLKVGVIGLSFVSIILLSQNEIQTFFRSQLITSSPINGPIEIRPVISALHKAFSISPDRIFCGSNTLIADRVDGIPGYECSRWAASLLGKDDEVAYTWRYSMIGTVPKDEISRPIRESAKSEVVIIDLINPADSNESWWKEYIPANWYNIEVTSVDH